MSLFDWTIKKIRDTAADLPDQPDYKVVRNGTDEPADPDTVRICGAEFDGHIDITCGRGRRGEAERAAEAIVMILNAFCDEADA